MNRTLYFWFGLLLVVMIGLWVAIGLPSFAPVKDLRPALGQTYYVRTDGGSVERCTGLVDAPDPGNGTNQSCAWDHPFRALPPGAR